MPRGTAGATADLTRSGTVDRDLELAVLDARLHVLRAVQRAQARPHELLRIVAEASADEAIERLQSEWGLDEPQAHAVLDLQVRRFTTDFAARRAEEIASLNDLRRRIASGEEAN
jgi:DNA gyrase/topoisomerase IV subunit A